MALLLLSQGMPVMPCKRQPSRLWGKSTMTRSTWLLLGAVVMGIAIVVYLVVLCPTECY